MEAGEKGLGSESCSLGLSESSDIDMSDWNGTILGPPRSTHENRIYCVSLHCGPNYPTEPPTVQFQTQINLPCVDETGKVIPAKLPCLAKWQYNYTMERVLLSLRKEMAAPGNSKRSQPPEGSCYS